MTLLSIKYVNGTLEILDQLRLPFETEYIRIENTEDGWRVIKMMQVRGAPAIAMVGCLSLAVELLKSDFCSVPELVTFIHEKLSYLVTARPTAVNMSDSAKTFSRKASELSQSPGITVTDLKNRIVTDIEAMLEKDLKENQAVGFHGAEHILNTYNHQSVKVLTHCNTGSLATAGYGTALGVIRALHEKERLEFAYCTETRPYNQGARLTAYELVYEKIPGTLICDSMVAMLMERHEINAVVVGADRVVANGDTANKIGTYQLAIIAKYHNVPFYVACPTTSYDPSRSSGSEIVIEERPHHEMTSVKGVPIAAPGIDCWNPAFDITPADLITGGIITEFGVFKPSELHTKIQEHKG